MNKDKPHCGTIEEWSTCTEHNPYLAPEMRGTCVQGILNLTKIVTSRLIDVNGSEIETGYSRYTLGKISDDFVQWMKDHNILFDPENPIRIVDKLTVVK